MINYLQNFDNNPFGTLQNNLAKVLANKTGAFNLQQAQQNAEQQEAYDKLKMQAMQTGDYSQLRPEDQQVFMKTEAMKQDLIDRDAGRTAFGIIRALKSGDTNTAKTIIAQNADDINALGDPSFTAESALQLVDSDPQALANMSQGVINLTGFKSPQKTTKQRDFEYLKSLSPEDRALFGEAQRGKQTPIDVQIENQERKDNQAIKTAARKKEAELGVTELNKIANDSKAAGNQLNTISRLKTLNDKAFAGTGADFALGVGKIAKEFGVPVEGVSASTQFKAIANELVLNKSQQMPGALSNADMEFLKETAPTLSQDREGRAKMLEYAEALAKREKEYAKQAQAFKKRNGYFNRSEFQQEFDQYAEENPLFEGEKTTEIKSSNPKEFTTKSGIKFTVEGV